MGRKGGGYIYISVKVAIAFILASLINMGPSAAAEYDVRQYGAVGDGRTLDTSAINAAIAAAAAGGGGYVRVPAGQYLSFSIHLRSHVTLILAPGAEIVAAEPSADLSVGYDAPEPNHDFERHQDFGHSHWHNSLIWGENLDDVGIVGPGRLFGKGLSRGVPDQRRDLTPEERRAGATPDLSIPRTAAGRIAADKEAFNDWLPPGVGNKAIALKNCRNVIFRDFTIYHGGHFGILATGVDNWTCDNLKIDTNRDGVDFDCCRNVRVANCTVNSPNDDAICPKSSYALGAGRQTENVTIINCHVSGYDEGTLLDGTCTRRDSHVFGGTPTGRIKCGTESNGAFRNIAISNCVFDYCRGLALESVDGAVMEDIIVSNLIMRDIGNAPIFIRLGARLRGPVPIEVGRARRIRIDNVIAHGVAAQSGILIAGIPNHPVEDVTISNLQIDYAGGLPSSAAERVVPEYERDYPDPAKFGTMPAWGVWVRHAKNLTVHHAEFQTLEPDGRPAVLLDDVVGAYLEHVALPVSAPGHALWIRNVRKLLVESCRGVRERREDEVIESENE